MPADQRRTARLALARCSPSRSCSGCGGGSARASGGPLDQSGSVVHDDLPFGSGTGHLDAGPRRTPAGCRRWQVADLPAEARHTLELIAAGGPYPYSRDGVVFQNRERLLPRKTGGYYHEYTVPTPGEGDRGARRIITGKGGERYWTADHYGSFRFASSREVAR